MRYRTLVSALVLTASSAACAEDSALLTVGQAQDRQRWQLFDDGMSPTQYRDAYRHNQHLILDYVKTYSTDTLRSAGVPKAGINLMGAAAGLATGQDATFYLNKSRLFAVEVKDATDADRSLMFGIKLDW